MPDEQNQNVVAPGVTPVATPAPVQESPEEAPASSFDMDSFRKSLGDAAQEVVSRAEFESVKRQAGQTKALQKEIADLRSQLGQRPADSVSREEYDALLEVLRDAMPDDRRAALDNTRARANAENAVTEKLTAFEKRVFERLGLEKEPEEVPLTNDPEVVTAVMERAWGLADQQVRAYAQARGVTLTQDDFNTARAASGGDRPDIAVEHIARAIDARAARAPAAPASREDRVSERREAASGGRGDAGPSDGSMGKFDMSSLSGLAQARKAGAITSAQFKERYDELNRQGGR